jgi:hypothetical protein
LIEFWELFVARLAEIGGADADAAMEAVLAALRLVDPRLTCFVGNHDEGHDVIFSIEGHYDLGPLLDELLRIAPAMPTWRLIPLVDSSLLFGERNAVLFPDDETGNLLMSMAAHGDLLWRERPVDFVVTFPTQEAAAKFGIGLADGLLVDAQVQITRPMVLVHAALTEAEAELGALAATHGGTVDGWSCYQVSASAK